VVVTGNKNSRGPSVVLTRRRSRPLGESSESLDQVFSALSSPTRRAILARLSKGESNVTDLARPFDMSLPAISKHLHILEQAHIVIIIKDGRSHRCRLAPGPLTKAEQWIGFYKRMWEGQLDSLTGFLSNTEDWGS
jgi:DNA-binding transcriptional ArsR family regulator